MPILSYRGQSTHRVTVGNSNQSANNKIHNTYLKSIPFYQYDNGLYDTYHRSQNKAMYDSMYSNAIFMQGYCPLGGGDRYAWTISQMFAGLGKLIIPMEYNMHRYDRSATTDLTARIKVPAMIANYGSEKNGSIRFLPNKKNPSIVDLYPHPLLQNVQIAKQFGGLNKVLNADIIKVSANQLPNYLTNHEKYFLDENDNLRSMDVWKSYQATGKMNWGSIYYPPELDDNMGWGYHIFTNDFRRQCANFGYYSINRLETVYEDNPNAASNYLNAYLKLHNMQDKDINRQYYNIELEEKTYTAEYVFKDVFEKVFGNFNQEDFTFVYKDKTYRIDEDTNTIYDENGDEVLLFKLDDGSYFSTQYEKAITRAVKDEIKPYIDNFIQFLSNKPSIISMRGEAFYWYYISYSYNDNDTIVGYTTKQTYTDYTGYTKERANYIINEVNGLYMSANRLDISQLISIDSKYTFSYTNLSKSRDDLGNSSYENSMMTPILMTNYIDYYTNTSYTFSLQQKMRQYPFWGQNNFILEPTIFKDTKYCPLPSSLARFYGDTFVGYNHSNTTEHYAYFPHTTPLNSVLDNYLGYEGEGQNIVFKYDSDGNILYGEDGLPVIDEDKTTYPEKVDEFCNLPLSDRIYKVLTKYPYLIDLENIYLEKSIAYTHTVTFTELSRTTIDSDLKDNMGNTFKNYEIEVEPMFQVKEIKYNLGLLPYYKIVTDGSNTTQNIDYVKDYKFSPLFYVYDIDNYNMHLWRRIPETKKLKFVFMKDIIDELEKVGNNYIEVRYSYDDENGIQHNESIDVDGDINSIRLNFCGNKVSYKMIRYCPQVLLAVGSDRVTTIERGTDVYLGGTALQICAGISIALLAGVFTAPFAAGTWAAGIAIFLATVRKIYCHTIGFRYKQEGDFFYNIGNRWEWIYNKNNGKRLDMWDKFENPSYEMDVRDYSNERKVKRNPPAPRTFSDRSFKSRKTKYDPYINADVPCGMEYQERPFVLSSFSDGELKNKIGSNTRFKGNLSSKESKAYQNRTSFTNNYSDYVKSDVPNNLTHIYYGQKMCLTWMLNGNLRKVQSLLKSAYIYLDYLCSIKGVINGMKYVPLIIPHRMQFQSFKKNIRIGRYQLDDQDLAELGDKNYKLSIVGDRFYVLNKSKNDKVMIDFKSYIPDYRTHYSTTNQVANIKATILPEVKALYNGKGSDSWLNWYKININEINHNGDYANIPKLSDDELGTMEDFIKEYLSTLTDDELLKIYNDDNNTDFKYIVDTNYSSENTLDTNGEINQFVNNQTEDNSITTIKNFTLSKIQEGIINVRYYLKKYPTSEQDYYRYVFESQLNNQRITYDIRTLCLGYQIALEKIMQGKSEIVDESFSNRFYTYLDADEGTISKTTIINYLVEQLKDIIPSSIIITIDELRAILSVTNKYTNLFDLNPLNVNSIAYNLWIRYYVAPNDIKDKLLELQSEIVSWKVLLQKNAIITRDLSDKNNSICSMLPMYQDVWRKIPYNAKLFYGQFSFTYDLYYEQLVPQRMGGYDAVIVRSGLIWKSIFMSLLAIIIAIILTIFTGGAGIMLALAIIMITLSAIAFIFQAIGAFSTNPETQRRMNNLSKSFNQAAQVVGIITVIYGLQDMIVKEGIKSLADMSAKQIINTIATALQITSTIVASTTNNDSVRRTWGYIGLGSTMVSMSTNMKWKGPDNKINASLTTMNIIQLTTQINNLINQIIADIYNRKIDNMEQNLKQLEQLSKELEDEIETEETELMTNANAMSVFNAKRPLSLSQYEDYPNLLLSNSNQLPSTDTDEIIEATFEVLET